MPVKTSTLAPGTDRSVVNAIMAMVTYINDLEQRIAQLQAQIAALPPILSLDQINKGLSATGTAPLNLSGLVGSDGKPL